MYRYKKNGNFSGDIFWFHLLRYCVEHFRASCSKEWLCMVKKRGFIKFCEVTLGVLVDGVYGRDSQLKLVKEVMIQGMVGVFHLHLVTQNQCILL